MPHDRATKVPRKLYEQELLRLQGELVQLKEWVRTTGERLVVLFEGRDAAGKGGAIKRVTEYLNPRAARIVALPAPTERERSQWYFQRYIAHLPSAGEMVIFDRSWYNRAGVEHVMGFCTPAEYRHFLQQCPIFERLVVDDGIRLIKYWFSVSDESRSVASARVSKIRSGAGSCHRLISSRVHAGSRTPARRTRCSCTRTSRMPRYVVEGDDKRRARLNCIAHLLSIVAYHDVFEAPTRAATPATRSRLPAAAAKPVPLRARPHGGTAHLKTPQPRGWGDLRGFRRQAAWIARSRSALALAA